MEINNASSNDNNTNNGNILKELSDIKLSLGINTNETQNIKDTINEIKGDVKEMKKNYITQEQHKELVESHQDHELRLRSNESNITRIMTWGSALILLVGLVEFLINTYLR